jgi:NADP-dependent 3-hydroxy acid dehydrogenase YdfG
VTVSPNIQDNTAKRFQRKGIVQMNSKTILITGASTGFGRDPAETLAKAGYKGFASVRDLRRKNSAHAQTLRDRRIEVVELDVTDETSVDRAVKVLSTPPAVSTC